MIWLALGLVVLWILSGALIAKVAGSTPRPGSRPLVRTTNRWLGVVGEPITVAVHVRAEEPPVSRDQPVKSFDVVLALDRSSSMQGAPLVEAKKAALAFVKSTFGVHVSIGVVAFHHEAKVVAPVGSEEPALQQAVQAITAGGTTSIDLGLRVAGEALGRRDRERMVILLSDGGSGYDAAMAEGDRLKADGIRIVTIALGTAADRRLMGDLASSPEDALRTYSPEVLSVLFGHVAASLEEMGGHQADITEWLNDRAFRLSDEGDGVPEHAFAVPGNENAPLDEDARRVARVRTDLGQARRLRWFLPGVTYTAKRVTYQVKPKHWGWHRLTLAPATLHYHALDGLPRDFMSNVRPWVLVVPQFGRTFFAGLFHPFACWLAAKILKLTDPPPPVGPNLEEVPIAAFPDPQPIALPPLTPYRPVVAPALVIGLGRAGLCVLRRLKQSLEETFDGSVPDWVKLLSVGLGDAKGGPHVGPGSDLDDQESLWFTPSLEPVVKAAANDPAGHVSLGWLPARRMQREIAPGQLTPSEGTRGDRFVGRLALFAALETVDAAVRERLSALPADGTRVWVVADGSGGFAGSALIDICALTAAASKDLGRQLSTSGLVLTEEASYVAPARNMNLAVLGRELDRIVPLWDRPLRETLGHNWQREVVAERLVDELVVVGDNPAPHVSDERLLLRTARAAEYISLALECPGLQQALHTLSPEVTAEMREQDGAVSHSPGIGSVHLPARSIEETLVPRAVLDFAVEHLVPAESHDGRFCPAMDESIEARAAFLVERLLAGTELVRALPPGITELGGLQSRSGFYESLQVCTEALMGIGSASEAEHYADGYAAQLRLALEEWARSALRSDVVLGGNATVERGGALRALGSALGQLETACGESLRLIGATEGEAEQEKLREFLPDAPQQAAIRWTAVVLDAYQAVFHHLRVEIDGWLALLTEGTGAPPSRAPSEAMALARGVCRLASCRYQAGRVALAAMTASPFPRMIADPATQDAMYAKSFEPARPGLLDRVLWDVRREGSPPALRVELHVHATQHRVFALPDLRGLTWSETAVRQHEAAVEIYDALCELVRSTAASPVRAEELRDHIGAGEQQMVAELRRDALISAPVEGHRGRSREISLVYGRPFSGPDAPLRAELEATLGKTCVDLGADNPHRWTYANIQAVQLLRQVHSIRLAQRDVAAGSHARLPFVFVEEQQAARLEDTLPQVSGQSAWLSPRLVGYLDRPDLLRAFLVALAKGLIVDVQHTERTRLQLSFEGKQHWLHDERIPRDDERFFSSLRRFIDRGKDGCEIPREDLLAWGNRILDAEDARDIAEELPRSRLVVGLVGKQRAAQLATMLQLLAASLAGGDA